MLNDGGIDCVFERWGAASRGCRFGDEGFENRVLWQEVVSWLIFCAAAGLLSE